MIDLGHWQLKPQLEWDNNAFGFIYLITNLTNNKKYIGCKMLQKVIKRKPLKGKKNKRHETIESDWRTYTSSSNELNKDIELLGKENFKFEIIDFAYSKSHLKYLEAKYQFDNDVLLSESWYNGIINLRVGKIKINNTLSNTSKPSQT